MACQGPKRTRPRGDAAARRPEAPESPPARRLTAEQLRRLADPTLGNLELSLHVDRVDCHEDGRVVLRTCKLGALAEVVSLLAEDDRRPAADVPADTAGGAKRVTPRRRAKLRTEPLAPDGAAQEAAAHWAADPHRFAGLGEQWFWEDVFRVPARTCWSEEHAEAVERCRAATGWSGGQAGPTLRGQPADDPPGAADRGAAAGGWRPAAGLSGSAWRRGPLF